MLYGNSHERIIIFFDELLYMLVFIYFLFLVDKNRNKPYLCLTSIYLSTQCFLIAFSSINAVRHGGVRPDKFKWLDVLRDSAEFK